MFVVVVVVVVVLVLLVAVAVAAAERVAVAVAVGVGGVVVVVVVVTVQPVQYARQSLRLKKGAGQNALNDIFCVHRCPRSGARSHLERCAFRPVACVHVKRGCPEVGRMGMSWDDATCRLQWPNV